MKTYKILIADDEPAMVASLGIRLRAEGFDVVVAHDGYQAVALARTAWPDLLILDINMPAGDGFSVHERVWKMVHLRRTPVIYMTGDASRQLSETAHKLGATSLLRKPFHASELLQLVNETLHRETSDDDSRILIS
jgi:two-component system KDP operon response regulator KdpE